MIISTTFRALIIAIPLLLVGGVFYFSQVRVVEVHADSALQDIDKKKNFTKIETHLNSYKGRPLWRVNLKKITHEIKTSYPFGDIHIVRQWPDRLVVFLSQIKPTLLILKKNKFYSVSYEGEIQLEIQPSQSLDFPVLRGEAFWKNKELRKKAVHFLNSLPEQGLLTSQSISEINYHKKNKSFLVYLMPYGFLVEWRGELHPKRIQNINFVLNYMQEKGGSSYHIDARFPRKIIVNKSK